MGDGQAAHTEHQYFPLHRPIDLAHPPMSEFDNPAFADPAAAQGSGASPASQLQSQHGTAVFFHLVFKGLALFTYLFCNVLSSTEHFVPVFVTCVVFLACDFWMVKNVSGRLLVGLRWWNEV